MLFWDGVVDEFVEVCKKTIFMDDAMAASFPPAKCLEWVERKIQEGWDGFVIKDGRGYKRVVLRMEKDGVCRFPVVDGEATQLLKNRKVEVKRAVPEKVEAPKNYEDNTNGGVYCYYPYDNLEMY